MESRIVRHPAGRSVGDHVCWPVAGRDEWTSIARPYLREGLDRGERVVVTGPGRVDDLRADLEGVPGLDDAVGSDQLRIVPLESMPGTDPGRDPAERLATVDAMTRAAIDDGWSGLRTIADTSDRVVEPDARRAHVRYEHLLDRFVLHHPLIVLCAYDVDVLDDDAVADLCRVHSWVHDHRCTFLVHAGADADLVLTGAVDALASAALARVLRQLGPLGGPSEVVVDCSELEFADHRALAALGDHAAATGVDVVLRRPPPAVRRLLPLLGLARVRLEDAAGASA